MSRENAEIHCGVEDCCQNTLFCNGCAAYAKAFGEDGSCRTLPGGWQQFLCCTPRMVRKPGSALAVSILAYGPDFLDAKKLSVKNWGTR